MRSTERGLVRHSNVFGRSSGVGPMLRDVDRIWGRSNKSVAVPNELGATPTRSSSTCEAIPLRGGAIEAPSRLILFGGSLSFKDRNASSDREAVERSHRRKCRKAAPGRRAPWRADMAHGPRLTNASVEA